MDLFIARSMTRAFPLSGGIDPRKLPRDPVYEVRDPSAFDEYFSRSEIGRHDGGRNEAGGVSIRWIYGHRSSTGRTHDGILLSSLQTNVKAYTPRLFAADSAAASLRLFIENTGRK